MKPQLMPQSRVHRQGSVRRAIERAANLSIRALGTRMAAVLHGAGEGHAFLGGVAMVHDDGIDIQRQVAGAQGLNALAQRDARTPGARAQRLVRKALGAKVFKGLEIVLAQSMQGCFFTTNATESAIDASFTRRLKGRRGLSI